MKKVLSADGEQLCCTSLAFLGVYSKPVISLFIAIIINLFQLLNCSYLNPQVSFFLVLLPIPLVDGGESQRTALFCSVASWGETTVLP